MKSSVKSGTVRRRQVLQRKAKAKANAKSQSSAKDKDHTHKFKEHTPKKRCSRKTPEKQQKAIVAKRPHFPLEKDRGQFMCRTGVGGAGSTYKISLGASKQYKTESAALKAAEHWMQRECALRGLECN